MMDKLFLYLQYPFVRYALIVGVLIAVVIAVLICHLRFFRNHHIHSGGNAGWINHCSCRCSGVCSLLCGRKNHRRYSEMKNKKIFCVLLCAILIAALAGCGSSGNSGRTSNGQKGVEDVLQEGMAEADKASSDEVENDLQETDARQSGLNDNAPESEVDADTNTVLSSTEGIDVDLTSLSSTMVYSEVYNMMYDPDSYLGKTIKMDGLFTAYHDESTGNNYFACIIQDATACCAQGVEFVLTDDYSYPNDYPSEGDEITVTGVFDTYNEGDYMYCTLRDASLQ